MNSSADEGRLRDDSSVPGIRQPVDEQANAAIVGVEWRGIRKTRGDYAGKQTCSPQHFVVELQPSGLVVALKADIHGNQDAIARLEPQVHGVRHRQAAHEQRRGDQQDH